MNNSTNNNNTNQPEATKRVFVDLWANETLVQKRRIVVEVPTDCDDKEIKEVGGLTLSEIADEQCVDAHWETDYPDDFDVQDCINIEDGVPEHLEADLVLVQSEDGNLVVVASKN